MKMNVSGTYHELAAFLDRLERSSYFVTVDQIQIGKRERGGEAGLDIALSAFYRASATARRRSGGERRSAASPISSSWPRSSS
jgi:Tfp pilus assembly protein PilO